MIGFVLSLVVTLAIALLGIRPPALEAVQDDLYTTLLRTRFPQARVTVHTTAAPREGLAPAVLQHLDAELTGLVFQGLPLTSLHGEASLIGPAGTLAPGYAIKAEALLTPADLQRGVDQLLARLARDPLVVQLPFLGSVTPRLPRATLVLQDGRVGFAGDATLRPGSKPQHVELSFALAVSPDRQQLHLVQPHASLNGRALPPLLLGGMLGQLPSLALAELKLPSEVSWTLRDPRLDATGLVLGLDGLLPPRRELAN